MPSLSAIHHISLTVTDLARSAEWYQTVLGFAVHSEIEGDTFCRTRLRHPDAPITLTLTSHESGSTGAFRETTPGLDHVAFSVPSVAEVEEWKQRFEEHGVEHSDIKRRAANAAMITFRDPDNIQLEVAAIA